MPKSDSSIPNSTNSIRIDATKHSYGGFFLNFERWFRGSAELLDQDDSSTLSSADIRHIFLERWCPPTGGRYCIRKKGSGATERWLLFPHPDDIATGTDRCLVGVDDKIPGVLLELRQWTDKYTEEVTNYLAAVTILQVPNVKPNKDDVVFTVEVKIKERDKFWEVPETPSNVLKWLRAIPSKEEEVTTHLEDWRNYLNWRIEDYRTNEWGAKIIKFHPWSTDNPFFRIEIAAPEEAWRKIRRNSRGMAVIGMKREESSSEEVWARPEEGPDGKSRRRRSAGTKAGNIQSVEKKTFTDKNGMMRGFLKIRPTNPEKPEQGLNSTWEGHFLINDIALDLIQVERQRSALERLENLDSSSFNNLHDWIFDITKAESGPSQPPELNHEILSTMNEEQEAAVRGALAAPDAYLIQGPPGTGKTTVIAEIINQATSDGQRVLLASQSNLAVDNALGRLSYNSRVRPIRRVARSALGDPDAEPFLEDNVVGQFFIPSIKRVSMESHDASEELTENRDALVRCLQETTSIKEEWRNRNDKIEELSRQIRELTDEERKTTDKISSLRRERASVNLLSTLFDDRLPHRITEEMSTALGIEHTRIEDLAKHFEMTDEKDHLAALFDHLSSSATEGSKVDPEAIRLREQEDEAAKAGDYVKAKEAQEALAALESEKDGATPSWSKWTRVLNRILRRLDRVDYLADLDDLSTKLNKPADFESKVLEELERIRDRIVKIDEHIIGLEASRTETMDELKILIPQRLGGMDSIIDEEIKRSESLSKDRTSLLKKQERQVKMRDDASDNWEQLIRSLPKGVAEGLEDIEGADPKKVIESSRKWLEDHRNEIEEDDKWRGIRDSWIKELEEASAVTLRDLKEMYLRLVNVEGVTTSYAGMWSWYGEKMAEPFDIVIIDEISKATPPEILMPCLLGKKCVLVGDHRQLPPTFKPASYRGPDELDAGEFSKRDDRVNDFERMVTSALFAEHFQNAHESLKTTLRVQYRMHEQIMNCINEFYEGQLSRGLTPDEQEDSKQHGFTICKKDSGGSHLREGSELINPAYHAVWIDSSFDRNGRFCCETQRQASTSRRNEREAHLARVLLDEFNSQIGESKQNCSPQEWRENHMLRHLDHEGRLPVAFITFYADKKRAFNEFANEGMAWTAMRSRWEHLTVRADTVDKFQGGERPVVIVSMVVSGNLKADRGKVEKFEGAVADLIDNPAKMAKRNEFRPGQIAGITTPFIRSPERINVAFSRAQNLLVILGNRYSLNRIAPESGKNQGVRITRDDGSKTRRAIYRQIQDKIGEGGIIDGRDLL